MCNFANSFITPIFFGFKAKQMPTDTAHLKRIVKSKYPFVERNLDDIAYTIWNALEYSYAFEGIAEQLKKERSEQVC
jgi:exosome complex exonuclease RRP6